MGRLIPPHRGAWAKTLPPLLRLVHDTEITPDCHYWNGDFHDFDGDRLAVFSWAPPASSSCVYVVIRALYVYRNNMDPGERLHLRRTCPHNACVNDAHLARVGGVHDHVLVEPFQLRDGVLVEPRAIREHVHLQPRDVSYAMCGLSMHRSLPAFGQVITCASCVASMAGKGYDLD